MELVCKLDHVDCSTRCIEAVHCAVQLHATWVDLVGLDCSHVEGGKRGRGARGKRRELCLGSHECHRHEEEYGNGKDQAD
jgi:hypothetical protein